MDIILSNASDLPIYQQIVDQLVDQIINGKIKPGDALPSMRILAKELKVSVITTKRVYEELEKGGYIESVVGKGTFVSGINQELLKERKIEILEEDLIQIIDRAKRIDLSKEEIVHRIDLLWDE